jgi:hypothetical protein
MKTKVNILLLALFIFILSNPAFAKIEHLGERDRSILLKPASNVTMLYSMKDLPASVLLACRNIVSDHQCNFADPNEEYQNTDVITKSGLPWSRLIWVAHKTDYYIVHFETGGIGHTSSIFVFKAVTNNHATAVWKATSNHNFKSYFDFLSAVKHDALDDDQNIVY